MLPELCASCGKLKDHKLGRRVKKRGRAHDTSWICFHCLDGGKKLQCAYGRSPLEIEARKAVLNLGYKFEEQYSIGPFRYDLALPALRLLIEIDSKRWHSHPSRKARDRRKTKLAKAEGWELARISSKHTDSIEFAVRQEVLRRETELSLNHQDL
jgi:very-short-patch-repair endonuclease